MEADNVPQDCQPIYHDRPEWLSRPDFWALHVFSFCCLHYGCEISENEIIEAFDMRAAEIWNFGAREFTAAAGPDGYPCYRLTLPLPGGAGLAFEYHEFPEDAHMQYRIYPSGGAMSVRIGGYNGQSWDAEISWTELKAVSKFVRTATRDKLYRAATFPLLFPGMLFSDSDNTREIHDELRDSWILLGIAKSDRIDLIVEAMVAESRGVSRYIREQPYAATPRARYLMQFLTRLSDVD
jgi:hypothetical protein